MRLQELYIKDYKVLQDFTLRFDEESAVSVLIGENGSGKTTVIECLTLIFAELYRHKTIYSLFDQTSFPFSFHIRYVLYTGTQIDFDYQHEVREAFPYTYEGTLEVQLAYDVELKVEVHEGANTYSTSDQLVQFLQGEGFTRQVNYILPSNVVLYYSGISRFLESIVDDYQQQTILGSLDGENAATSELFYFKPENFPALLIGLLSFQYGNIPERLERDFHIDQDIPFNYITIRMRRPRWAKSKTTPEQFWGAKGDLEVFLKVLRDNTNTEFGSDHVTFNILNRDQLTNIWSFYGIEKSLFDYLIALQANGLIESIDIDLRKSKDLAVSYDRLSEGEKQLLIIMALRELLSAGENSLFLFDEPDTFLHPTWQVKFIEELQTDLEQAIQYIITTHSPLLLNHAKADISKIRVSQMINGKLSDYSPRYAGRDIATVLYELMGVEERPAEIRAQLTKLFSLIEDENIVDARTLLLQIAAIVGSDDPELTKAQVEIDFIKELNETNNKG